MTTLIDRIKMALFALAMVQDDLTNDCYSQVGRPNLTSVGLLLADEALDGLSEDEREQLLSTAEDWAKETGGWPEHLVERVYH